MLTVVFLLLPALAYGKIAVLVNFAAESPYVDVHGESSNLITDQQREVFKITDQQLKEAIANYTNEKDTPRDVFVKEESRYNLHKTYNLLEIRRTVKANAKNFSITCETKPWTIRKGFVNKFSLLDNNTPFLSENVILTIQNEFDTAKFDSDWGYKNKIEEHHFSVPFRPANLKKCEIVFDLEYVATLTGDVVVNYNHKREGHYFWAFDIKNVQRSNGLPTTVVRHQNVKVRYGKPLPESADTIPT